MGPYWQYLKNVCAVDQLGIVEGCRVPDGYASTELIDESKVAQLAARVAPCDIERILEFKNSDMQAWLKSALIALVQSSQSFQFLYEEQKHLHLLNRVCVNFASEHALAFRLRVLSHCLPYEFQQSLFCVLMVVFESEFCGRDEQAFDELALSALAHDVGLLELDENLTIESHSRRSDNFEKNKYYQHVELAIAFLKNATQYSAAIIRGVQEHHESMDGSGYPSGRLGAQLSEIGQHIHLYDTLFAVHNRFYKPLGKDVADLLPIVKMNAVTHFGAVANNIIRLLETVPRSAQVFFTSSQLAQILGEVRLMDRYVESALMEIQKFTSSVGFRHDDKSLLLLQNSFFHIALAKDKTKTLDKELIFNLEAEVFNDDQKKQLEEQYFSLREMAYHVNKFKYQLNLYEEKCKFEKILPSISAAKRALSSLVLARLS